jgi:hypothetical protein
MSEPRQSFGRIPRYEPFDALHGRRSAVTSTWAILGRRIGSLVFARVFPDPAEHGFEIVNDVKWRLRYKLAGDVLILEPEAGKLDAAAAELVGRHRLRLEADH